MAWAVRDGCAVHGGWYDDAADRLLLEVQTVPLQDSLDRLPTRVVALRELEPTEGEGGLGALALPAAPDRRAAAAALDSVEVPFDRGVGYLLDDGVTLLAQELTDSEASAPGVWIDGLWRSGEVGLRRTREDATGRYAVVDLAARVVRGSIVSAADEEEAEAAGVVCVTPGGRVYLAVAPDALLVLDVMRPAAPSRMAVGLDLSWAACAWDGRADG